MEKKRERDENIGRGLFALTLPLMTVFVYMGNEPVSIPRPIVYGSLIFGILGAFAIVLGIIALIIGESKSKVFSNCATGISLILIPVILWNMTRDISFGDMGRRLWEGFKENWFVILGVTIVMSSTIRKLMRRENGS